MKKQDTMNHGRLDTLMILFYFLLLGGIIFIKAETYALTDRDCISFLENPWVWTKPDGTAQAVSASERVNLKAGETMVLVNQIPTGIAEGTALCFWSTLEQVRVWIDGELHYEYGFDGSIERVWNTVYIPPAKSGSEVVIEKTCLYEVYSGQIRPVFWGDYRSMQTHIIRQYFPDFVIGLIMMIFGGITIVAAVFMKRRQLYSRQGLYLGIFTVVLSLWICCESRIPPEYFPVNSIHISCTALLFAPIIYLLYIRERTDGRYQKLFRVALTIAGTNAALLLLLSLLGIADLVQTLPMTHLILVFLILFTSYAWMQEWKHRKQNHRDRGLHVLSLLSTVGLIIGTIAECMLFYTADYYSVGTYIQGAMLLYIVINVIRFFNDSMDRIKQAQVLSKELEENRLKMMLSQIQPHFLYNTLLAIQELCYTDAEKAADTIVTFADYLRNNMNFLEEAPFIPFSRELTHVQNYMDIQQIRFGEELTFLTDIRFSDFCIPPLSIQPLVENAVQHGIRKNPGGGTVKLTVKKSGEQITIITEDNGVGFDTAQCRDTSAFSALENVEKRIKKLLSGTIQVESEIGRGTRITLCIPYSGEEYFYESNNRR